MLELSLKLELELELILEIELVIGGSKGGRQGCVPPRGSKFFHFHAVFGKKLKNNSTFGSWHPPRENPGSATASDSVSTRGRASSSASTWKQGINHTVFE